MSVRSGAKLLVAVTLSLLALLFVSSMVSAEESCPPCPDCDASLDLTGTTSCLREQPDGSFVGPGTLHVSSTAEEDGVTVTLKAWFYEPYDPITGTITPD